MSKLGTVFFFFFNYHYVLFLGFYSSFSWISFLEVLALAVFAHSVALSLCFCLFLIYYEGIDLLCMLVVHVMSEVCYSGFGPRHMPKVHSVSLAHTLSPHAVHTHTHMRAWMACAYEAGRVPCTTA